MKKLFLGFIVLGLLTTPMAHAQMVDTSNWSQSQITSYLQLLEQLVALYQSMLQQLQSTPTITPNTGAGTGTDSPIFIQNVITPTTTIVETPTPEPIVVKQTLNATDIIDPVMVNTGPRDAFFDLTHFQADKSPFSVSIDVAQQTLVDPAVPDGLMLNLHAKNLTPGTAYPYTIHLEGKDWTATYSGTFLTANAE